MAPTPSTNTTLRILLVTDLHMNLDNIKKLGKDIINANEKLDYILCSGDISNFDPDDYGMEGEAEKTAACEGEMSAAIIELDNIHKDTFYIPGNHDSKTSLLNPVNERPQLTTFSTNVHKRCIRLAPDLVLMGLGGSLPGYRDGKQHWVGYPYQTDEQLSVDLHVTYKEAQSGADPILKDTDSILLMTHVGPHSSSTAIDRLHTDQSPIMSGSKAIEQFIIDHTKVFLNVHGHTHFAPGMTNYGKAAVINAGPLKFDRYALITIEKHVNAGWRLLSSEFKTL
ncbi:hypothetical protein SAMD00019534_071910 [Acytostelium subglobosum LB1]|uniref:hypothetical protein n=1 Tax=Acytostelium subglobosum LB1 TaxID=1410327 RepID=UPI0006449BBE|nr:hypothetical protein SAMD00019534_071910 [Acytostelium subglobosum LB1]GAM24016.1 hypothetical protein SAMD00019534_071910 [Acytostelium subglobosum LB1]|eukprot:XP_012753052.1 hypothetical protein SAMD00019534_071910 [Acytostelium subglobosum LB1]